MPSDERIFFRDVKPYEVPERLSELRGPVNGRVVLPRSVYWGPTSSADLDSPGDLIRTYQAVLQEGTAHQQASLVNADRLVAIWPELSLPQRVRELWEGRFPELIRAA